MRKLSRLPRTGPNIRIASIATMLIAVGVTRLHAVEPIPLAEAFVDQLSAGKFADAVDGFDATMAGAMPAAKLAKTWETIEKSAGKFARRTRSRVEKVAKYDVVYVTCNFARTPLDVRVVIDDSDKIAGLFFVPSKPKNVYKLPDYVDTSKFRDSDVTIGRDPWKLPGTLSIPNGDGPFPALVLVHGSGPGDRDETVGAAKPFKDLAGGLASRGVAVLRYDKRTKVHGAATTKSKDFTVKDETIDDAFAAVALLRENKRIDPQRVFILGHSLGGYLVPRMAEHEQRDRVAGFVMLAANTRPIEQLYEIQIKYILGLDGTVSKEDAAQIAETRKLAELINDPALEKTNDDRLLLGAPASYWLDLRGYKPHETARNVLSQPALILQGERDYQVTMIDFNQWKSTLSKKDNVTFKSYPKLNHLFVTGEHASVPSEYQKPGNVARKVVDDIAKWVNRVPKD